jgi:hypothetical protein
MGGAEEYKRQQAQGGPRYMRIFPSVAQLRPIGQGACAFVRAEAEKVRRKALEFEVLKPEND